MCEASPEKGGVTERLNVRKYARTGGGEARNRFKKRVNELRNISAYYKRKRAAKRENNPAERNGYKAVL